MTNLQSRLLDLFASRNLCELDSRQIPHPSTMSGISEASEIITNAMLKNQKIAIVGDYDTDGVSASCVMEAFFTALNYKNFTIQIPNRFIDGYGINTRMVGDSSADIFITVDNGISAFEVADFCRKIGKILIITDHHKPLIKDGAEILPNASVIINPNQQKCHFLQKEVCGAVVAWYLCAGIKQECLNRGLFGAESIDLLAFAPFLSLAIISDIMPLTALNRTLYKLGIKRINRAKSGAFALLREEFGTIRENGVKCVDSQDIAFKIAPLINSAGRLKDANLAFDFLRAKQTTQEAIIALDSLKATNNERKIIQNAVFCEAKLCALQSPNFVIALGSGWNEGVVGIVASKLAEDFDKSAFCLVEKNGALKGSGRARNGVDLIATVQKCAEFLTHFGGHSGAVGLTLARENLKGFAKMLESSVVFGEKYAESCAICVNLNEINIDILEILERFEPYGNGNEMVNFQSEVEVCGAKILKDSHQKLSFKDSRIQGILFNDTRDFLGQSVKITYHIQRDSYNGVGIQILKIEV